MDWVWPLGPDCRLSLGPGSSARRQPCRVLIASRFVNDAAIWPGFPRLFSASLHGHKTSSVVFLVFAPIALPIPRRWHGGPTQRRRGTSDQSLLLTGQREIDGRSLPGPVVGPISRISSWEAPLQAMRVYGVDQLSGVNHDPPIHRALASGGVMTIEGSRQD